MPEIGMLSGSLEEKELGYEPRSRVYAGEDWGWQTEESYQKIEEDRKSPIGMIKGSINFLGDRYQELNQWVSDVTPDPIENVLNATTDAVVEPLQDLYSKTPFGMADEGAVSAGEGIGNLTGNQGLGMAAGFLLGAVIPGPGELNVLKGSVRLPRPGSRGRYLTQDEFDIVQPARIRQTRDELDEASEIVQNIEEANPNIPNKVLKADKSTGYKSAVRNKEELQAKVSSEESNIATPTPDNVYAFPRDTAGAKQMKAAAAEENLKLGRSIEALEMHHLIPKGISAAVYNRARNFIEKGEATLEDLHRINAKFKKATGSDTGDLSTNMQPTRTTPHSTFHGEMRYQPSSTFKGEKLEISKEALTKQLNKIKTYKDFEALLDKFIADDIVPLVNDARNWEKMDDILRENNPGVYTGTAKYKP